MVQLKLLIALYSMQISRTLLLDFKSISFFCTGGPVSSGNTGHTHSHDHSQEHGHTHEHMENAGRFTDRDMPVSRKDFVEVGMQFKGDTGLMHWHISDVPSPVFNVKSASFAIHPIGFVNRGHTVNAHWICV